MFGLILAQIALLGLFLFAIVQPLYAYVANRNKLWRYPGPFPAQFTNLWAILHQYFHTRTLAVHKAHQKYGQIVRVGTDHVSFANIEAVKDVYGHGTPVTKDDFYQAFVSTHLNVSDAQEKSVHNTKRKRFAAALAQKRIVQHEETFCVHLRRVVELLDSKQRHGVEVDMKRVMLHLMYEATSVMMYAQDPNFILQESTVTTAETPNGALYKADMYASMIDSSRVGTSAGWGSKSIRLTKFLTKWHPGWDSGQGLRDVTLRFVRNRLRMDTERFRRGEAPLNDLFTTMLFDKDGEPLGLELGELVTEAANMFNAAGENTEIALTNTIWFLARDPGVTRKLRKELDAAFDRTAAPIPAYDALKDLPYLRACIDESLRLRPSIEGGLPRLVPKGGMYVGGEWLEGGTTVSISTHTLHRDSSIFHENPDAYVPERWLRPDANAMQRGFLAFSQGGRGCIGRNIAYFEMTLTIAVLVSRYDIQLREEGWELGLEENFSAHTKPLPVRLTMRSC